MLNKMIHWSLANRAVIIGISLILMVMGLRTATELPVEVLGAKYQWARAAGLLK